MTRTILILSGLLILSGCQTSEESTTPEPSEQQQETSTPANLVTEKPDLTIQQPAVDQLQVRQWEARRVRLASRLHSLQAERAALESQYQLDSKKEQPHAKKSKELSSNMSLLKKRYDKIASRYEELDSRRYTTFVAQSGRTVRILDTEIRDQRKRLKKMLIDVAQQRQQVSLEHDKLSAETTSPSPAIPDFQKMDAEIALLKRELSEINLKLKSE